MIRSETKRVGISEYTEEDALSDWTETGEPVSHLEAYQSDVGARIYARREDIRDSRKLAMFFFAKDIWQSMKTKSESIPVELGLSEGREWWLYAGDIFSTEEDLRPEEMLALVQEKEKRKRLKIARAKAVAAMADQPERGGERQPVPREVKVKVWQRDGGKCVECGSKENLEFDHIIPHSLGGANTERNLQLLCADCNKEKGASL